VPGVRGGGRRLADARTGLLAQGPNPGSVTFRAAAERQYLDRLTGAGIPAGTAELLITREWAILAGENDYTTGNFAQITSRPLRLVAEFLHEYRTEYT
jgi:NAD(P)H dehydrogenase (quinone)